MDGFTFLVMHGIAYDQRTKRRSEQEYWQDVEYLDLSFFTELREALRNWLSRLWSPREKFGECDECCQAGG